MFTSTTNPTINELQKLMPILSGPKDMMGETIKDIHRVRASDPSGNSWRWVLVFVFESEKMYILPGNFVLDYGTEINWRDLYESGLIHRNLFVTRQKYRDKIEAKTVLQDLMIERGISKEDIKEAINELD